MKCYQVVLGLHLCLVKFVLGTENLALKKPAYQSSTSNTAPASRAVDGDTSTIWASRSCMHTTEGESTAWWKVDLTDIKRIKSVKIYNRVEYLARLEGFVLYVSNSSGNPSPAWESCYSDVVSQSAAQVKEYDCVEIARYVGIYVDQSGNGPKAKSLNLCEVQVNGCPQNRFGNGNCDSTCHCAVGGCDPDTGVCDYSKYGCEAGWTGTSCTDACTSPMFGEDCSSRCGCKRGPCNNVDGVCQIPGCIAGYEGDSCNNQCDAQKYGEGCANTCNCLSDDCNKLTGVCDIPGCIKGWKGISCSQACTGNTFGYNCNATCHCKTGGCDTTTGVCEHSGCGAGWSGDSCDQECEAQKYGDGCENTCNCLSDDCNRLSGVCYTPGCKEGWKGISCSEECISPMFGKDCNTQCHCLSGECNIITGVCTTPGCIAGFSGESCSRECTTNRFGENCKNVCRCQLGECPRDTGICDIQGCLPGYQGDTCSIEESDSNSLMIGSTVGASVVILLAVGVLVFMYRRRKLSKQNKVPEQPTRSTLEHEKDKDYINMGITLTSSDNKSNLQSDPYSSLDTVGMPENVYDVIKN